MVKRRNSPYATHDRSARTRVPIDCTPSAIDPPARRPALRRAKPGTVWSLENPSGRFII
jgi:hypothetical protein